MPDSSSAAHGVGAQGDKSSFDALTALRGLAAWWIVAYHFKEALGLPAGSVLGRFVASGPLAVDLFFVMSGFVIALSYQDAILPVRKRVVLWFLGLRLARIYPLHFVMCVAFLLNPLAIALFSSNPVPGDRYDPGYYVLSLVLMQNWGFTSSLAWNGPAWSISTEWGAYIVFPVLAFAAARWVVSTLHAAAAALVLLALLAALGAATASIPNEVERVGLIRCILEFSLGMVACQAWRFRKGVGPHGGLLLAAAGLGTFATGIGLGAPAYLYAPAGFTFLVLSLTDRHALPARILSHSVIVRIGEVSYSTYLVHYFIKDWVKFVLVPAGVAGPQHFAVYVLATAVASVVLHKLVEVPGRVRGRTLVNALFGARART